MHVETIFLCDMQILLLQMGSRHMVCNGIVPVSVSLCSTSSVVSFIAYWRGVELFVFYRYSSDGYEGYL